MLRTNLGTSLIFMSSICWAGGAVPAWATNASHIDRYAYTTACNGKGPSLDLARNDSLTSCKKSAAAVLSKSFAVKSISVQTEQASGLHEEVSSTEQFQNLSCDPLQEEIKQDSGFFEVWTLCKFSIEGLKVNQEDSFHPKQISVDKTIRGEKYTLILTVIPDCKSIMILGDTPRQIECKSNPVLVTLSPKDRQLIVRGDILNYQPQTVELNNKETRDENIQIILIPN